MHAVFGKNHSVDAGDAVQLAFAIAFVKARSCIFLPLAAQADVAVHIDVSNIYQTAEQICLIGKARFHIIISGFVPETDLIGSIGHTIGTDSDAVSMFLANFCGHP